VTNKTPRWAFHDEKQIEQICTKFKPAENLANANWFSDSTAAIFSYPVSVVGQGSAN